jgi:chromosomal replication initiator protein
MQDLFWGQLEGGLKQKIGPTSFTRWFSQLKVQGATSSRVVLTCPNSFVLDWIKRYYYRDICTIIEEIAGKEVVVEFSLSPAEGNGAAKHCAPPHQMILPGTERHLHVFPFINREYRFHNFVVGPSNQFAYASALAVTESKPSLYNPLFFHSPGGLGKTHLSSAVGQKIISDHPDIKLFYTTAEWFAHEMIQALRKNLIQDFKEKYRKQCDVLVIEDVQFLEGKAKTQDEVFYTLDTLIQMGKQVVLTANANPREIKDLKSNLKSRMGSGLVVDIKTPDYETRRKIISAKCAEENVQISEDVADYMARSIKTNIRDIKSALIHLIANASLLKRQIDLDLARDMLKDFVQPKEVSISDIQQFISLQFKISLDQLKSKSRSRTVNYPRQVAYYFCRRYTDQTLADIGKFFNRNHSSVIRGLSQFETALHTNKSIKDVVNHLTEKFEKSYL